MDSFETGATSAQANNLVISVLTDGSVYEDRKHCGFAMLQGANHRLSFADLVKSEANKQRREFGSKFQAKHISEAIKLLQAQTIGDCLEIIAGEWSGQYISATCRRWWDKVNGNSYFSVHLSIPRENGWRSLNIPFQYGSHWEDVTVDTLRIIGLDLPKANYNSELPIYFIDEKWCNKRDAYHGIYICKK